MCSLVHCVNEFECLIPDPYDVTVYKTDVIFDLFSVHGWFSNSFEKGHANSNNDFSGTFSDISEQQFPMIATNNGQIIPVDHITVGNNYIASSGELSRVGMLSTNIYKLLFLLFLCSMLEYWYENGTQPSASGKSVLPMH